MLENRITKALFMFSLFALLGGSIPHVAWTYHLYEGTDNGQVGWIIAYSIASSIDVLIMWLSYIQSKGTLKDVSIVWFFIVALAVLSWYCNWIYDMSHSTIASSLVWSMSPIQMLTSFGTVQDLTPKIISALPLFILAYTYMHRRINAQKLNVADYRSYADELENLQTERSRIRHLKRLERTASITGFFNEIGTIGKNVSSLRAPSHKDTVPPSSIPAPSDEDTTIQPLLPASSDEDVIIAVPIVEQNTDALLLATVASNGHSNGNTPHVAHDDFTDFFENLK